MCACMIVYIHTRHSSIGFSRCQHAWWDPPPVRGGGGGEEPCEEPGRNQDAVSDWVAMGGGSYSSNFQSAGMDMLLILAAWAPTLGLTAVADSTVPQVVVDDNGEVKASSRRQTSEPSQNITIGSSICTSWSCLSQQGSRRTVGRRAFSCSGKQPLLARCSTARTRGPPWLTVPVPGGACRGRSAAWPPPRVDAPIVAWDLKLHVQPA